MKTGLARAHSERALMSRVRVCQPTYQVVSRIPQKHHLSERGRGGVFIASS